MVNIIPDIKKGNIGTILKCTITKPDPSVAEEDYTGAENQRIAVDLTTSTSVQIEVEKPNGQRLGPYTATITNPPGTDGIIEYTDTTGIFDVKGRWKARGIATFSTGYTFKGTWKGFPVGD